MAAPAAVSRLVTDFAEQADAAEVAHACRYLEALGATRGHDPLPDMVPPSGAGSPETCPDACVKPSEVRRGGGPTSFIAALREVCDRNSRRYAVFKYRSRLLNQEQMAAVPTYIDAPPIRFRFISDEAFYCSLDNAKGTGKGEHRDLFDKANG